GAGNHVHDNAVSLKSFENSQVGHAPGGSAAECYADANAAEIVNQPFQAGGHGPAPGQPERRFGDFEVATGELVEIRYRGDDRLVVLQEPGDAGFVAPAEFPAGERLQAADRRV